MVASGSRTMIACSLSSCIAGSHHPEGSHHHPARDPGALAQGRLSLLLALEVAPTGRATADRHGAARIGPPDEHGLWPFERAPHARRPAKAWLVGRQVDVHLVHSHTKGAMQSGI